MNENDKHFIKRYEELLDKGYCDCNEMNCIDNNSPRRILNIVNNLQSKIDKAIEYIEENIDLDMDDFTKIDIGCEIFKILDLDKYNEFLKEESK